MRATPNLDCAISVKWGRDALPRVRHCTSGSRCSSLCLSPPFVRLFTFYGRAGADARECLGRKHRLHSFGYIVYTLPWGGKLG